MWGCGCAASGEGTSEVVALLYIPKEEKKDAFDQPPSASAALQGITMVDRFIWYVAGKVGNSAFVILYVGTTHDDGVAHAWGIGRCAATIPVAAGGGIPVEVVVASTLHNTANGDHVERGMVGCGTAANTPG